MLAFLCALSFVLYLDRVCIGQAANSISADLGLSNSQMGWVHGAFLIAYGLFEIPTGWWGDRYGSRRVLTRIVVWWSLFTALTGAALGFGVLVLTRFLFGAGEAGAYPNMVRTVARWFPLAERGTAQGIVITSAQLGGALAPAMAAYLIAGIGWRLTFVAFSLLGFVWAIAFYGWYRDTPAEMRGAPARLDSASRDIPDARDMAGPPPTHADVPWRSVLTNPNVWLLGIFQSCSSFLSYMFMSWYPTYLVRGRDVEELTTGWLASLVLFGSAVGCLASGFFNDWLARITHRHPARFRVAGFTATTLAVAALLVSVQCESPFASSLWAAIAFLLAISQQATLWAVTTEISGPHIGVVFGLINSMGVPGGFISTVFVGRFVDAMAARGYTGRAQWDPAFYAYAAVLALGGCCWLLVNARRKIAPHDSTHA
ncbi:MAG: MFS transporter [Planctomycetaceae bacterium]|nr:MFS transporter [Planctomycetaceae bacterium]